MVQSFLEEEGDKQAFENELFDEDISYHDYSDNNDREENESHGRDKYISHIPHQIEIINRHYVKVC